MPEKLNILKFDKIEKLNLLLDKVALNEKLVDLNNDKFCDFKSVKLTNARIRR